jgi:eukaryotic-like serine/threonine-protein kinase
VRADTAPTLPANSLDSTQTSSSGIRIGRYEVIALLGSGGMGMIYRAHDPVMARDVALKVLREDPTTGTGGQAYQARLVREAHALAKLSHPNVVAAFDVGRHEGTVFVTMELISGASLRDWLPGRRSRREIIHTLIEAGRGLAAAHAAGVLHRDFKPANIMVSPDGRVRVVDFGLARPTGDGDLETPDPDQGIARIDPRRPDGALTVAGTVVGTPGYIAPEQLIGEPADERGDQFGFAATAFYALVGSPPYHGTTLEEYKLAIATGARTPWRRGVPRRVRRVLERGLGVNDQRYASVTELVDELAAVAAPRRGLAIGAAAGVLVTLAIVAVLATRGGTADPIADCELPSFAGVWDPGRKAEVAAAFAATGRAHAPESVARVSAQLDDVVAGSVAAARDLCRVTASGLATPQLLEVRAACLARHRSRVVGLVDAFSHADGVVVDQARLSSADTAAALEECSDVGALGRAARRALPPRAVEREVRRVEQALVEASAQVEAGRVALRPQLEALLVEAQRIGYVDLLARATLATAGGQIAEGKWQLAEASLRRALELAARTRDARLAAEVAGSLLHLMVRRHRWREADTLIATVTSQIQLSGDDPSLRAALLRDVAAVRGARNDVGGAEDAIRRAMGACDQLRTTRGRCRLETLDEHARVRSDAADPRGAAVALERVAAVTKELLGPGHPRLVKTYDHLASARAAAGDHDGALAALADAKHLVATLADADRARALHALTEGFIWKTHRDCERALPPLREARARLLAARDDEVLVADQNLGECLEQLGRPAEARTFYQHWVDGRRAARDATPGGIAEAEFALARSLWADPAERRRARQLARSALDALVEPGARQADEVRRWLANH